MQTMRDRGLVKLSRALCCALVALACSCLVGCSNPKTVWSTTAISPDGRWVAGARTQNLVWPGDRDGRVFCLSDACGGNAGSAGGDQLSRRPGLHTPSDQVVIGERAGGFGPCSSAIGSSGGQICRHTYQVGGPSGQWCYRLWCGRCPGESMKNGPSPAPHCPYEVRHLLCAAPARKTFRGHPSRHPE